MAPEQIEPGRYGINGKISTNLDLWSFGVRAYEFLTGKKLFTEDDEDTNMHEAMKRILVDPVDEKLSVLPEPYRSVIRLCLVRDASLRVQTASEVLMMLEGKIPVKQVAEEPMPQTQTHSSSTVEIKSAQPAAKTVTA
ncbi:MAG: hypothetical protein Fur0041_05050 [Bacteroidia bacterium]